MIEIDEATLAWELLKINDNIVSDVYAVIADYRLLTAFSDKIKEREWVDANMLVSIKLSNNVTPYLSQSTPMISSIVQYVQEYMTMYYYDNP